MLNLAIENLDILRTTRRSNNLFEHKDLQMLASTRRIEGCLGGADHPSILYGPRSRGTSTLGYSPSLVQPLVESACVCARRDV